MMVTGDKMDLDDPRVYPLADPSGMRQRLRSTPAACEEGWQQGLRQELPPHWSPIDQVVVGGLGGSAIAGDILRDLAALQKTVPVSVIRGAHIPFRVSGNTLFIACSVSGNTEETLSLFDQAVASRARLLVVAGGGALAQRAAARGVPLLPVRAPGEPRTALGSILLALLGVLVRLQLLRAEEKEVRAALESLSQQIMQVWEAVPTSHNPAKQLATQLKDKVVVVYGGGLFRAVARRWKTQLNENAKAWAFWEPLPEALHNAVESYGRPDGAGREVFGLVLEPATETRAEQQYDVLVKLLKRGGIAHHVVQSAHGAPLAALLNTLVLGDYVSYYLALLNCIDPSPTPFISLAKGRAEPTGTQSASP